MPGKKTAIFASFLIFLLSATLSAIDLDRVFEQNLNQQFFEQLRYGNGRERAVFFEITGSTEPLVAYLRFSQSRNRFILRGNLPPGIDTDTHLKAEIEAFSPTKKDNEPLYGKGTVLKYHLKFPESEDTVFFFLPYYINEKDNRCFVSDLGYFELHFCCHSGREKEIIEQTFKRIFNGRLNLSKTVRYNRYYLYKDSFWGPVDYTGDSMKEKPVFHNILPPTHKMTINKHIEDWQEKDEKDRQAFFDVLATDEYLLSQDNRLKLGLVPGFVKLNLSRLEHTDIGSGQNQFVFLSIGPGINYFDDPWMAQRRNLPCPRLILHPGVLDFSQIQLYPSFSIDSGETGERRLQAINRFQKSMDDSIKVRHPRLPLWISPTAEKKFMEELEKRILCYGLTNDSPELYPGFFFFEQSFRGNLINNEIRLHQGISLQAMLCGVIVPPDTAELYRQQYARLLENSRPHWQFNCGRHFSDLFIEAPTADDAGFRIAYLEWILRRSNPVLSRLIKACREKSDKALFFIAGKIDKLAAIEGRSFFLTPFFHHYFALEQRKFALWFDYLESLRTGHESSSTRLKAFIEFHSEMKEICR
ncbi:MAG: hypothetical protein ACOYXC_16040 [Candidatus Rifleibacteriota bacterium]